MGEFTPELPTLDSSDENSVEIRNLFCVDLSETARTNIKRHKPRCKPPGITAQDFHKLISV